jgi:hypothetical protein
LTKAGGEDGHAKSVYDGATVWDFISFGEHFAVWGQGHERWWAEYGDTAMEILDSAVFGK